MVSFIFFEVKLVFTFVGISVTGPSSARPLNFPWHIAKVIIYYTNY